MAEIKDSRDGQILSLVVVSQGANPTLAEVMSFTFRANMQMSPTNSFVAFEEIEDHVGYPHTRMECRELRF